METYITILRGINVSGHNLIKMDALKKLCADLGFENVQTYIQSGNIVFNASETERNTISSKLIQAISDTFGFQVPVITMKREELQSIIDHNPFMNDTSKDPSFFHITFLSDIPLEENYNAVLQSKYKNDQFQLIGKAIYLYCPDGYGNTKLTNTFWENKLKVKATTRNWKTSKQLINMAGNIRK